MAHPKAMYKNSVKGIVEKVAMSLDEEHDLSRAGWLPHPEEARLVPIQTRQKRSKK